MHSPKLDFFFSLAHNLQLPLWTRLLVSKTSFVTFYNKVYYLLELISKILYFFMEWQDYICLDTMNGLQYSS